MVHTENDLHVCVYGFGSTYGFSMKFRSGTNAGTEVEGAAGCAEGIGRGPTRSYYGSHCGTGVKQSRRRQWNVGTGLLLLMVAIAACNQSDQDTSQYMTDPPTTFGEDVDFLSRHTLLTVLRDSSGQAQVAVSAGMQGRVLTSTAAGRAGLSFGWINRPVIAARERQQHINVFGGEDRFWLGPEGGQYSIYFAGGDPLDLEHWYVPAAIDWEPFEVTEQGRNQVSFAKEMELTNYSGTKFSIRVNRAVRLIDREEALMDLGFSSDVDLTMVAFESLNTVTNAGDEAWVRDRGLLSVWILGMFNPSPATTVVIPFVSGSEEELGPVVNDAYFGSVPQDRLRIEEDVLFFRGDGRYRSKLGLSPRRSLPVFGSYDAARGVLTLVQYTVPSGSADYVNSMWEIQDQPYEGDMINTYNDGSPAPGVAPLGPFYELETSSPALALAQDSAYTHVHRTIHLQGSRGALSLVAQATLGRTLDEIQAAFDE